MTLHEPGVAAARAEGHAPARYDCVAGAKAAGRAPAVRAHRVVAALVIATFVTSLAFSAEPTSAKRRSVRDSVLAWLTAQKIDEMILAQAIALWPEEAANWTHERLLDQLALTLSLIDERARSLLEHCKKPLSPTTAPPQDWLAEASLSPLVRDNLRLVHGRWLVHERLYDEALVALAEIDPDQVVDRAALHFYRAVASAQLVDRAAALESLDRLEQLKPAAPDRYLAVARLLRAELSELKDDSLDHIARRMTDIERRLDLGRAGPAVRKIEDGVIESLDKLIRDLEAQQQQQQAAAAAAAGGEQQGGRGGNQPNSPAPDSRILGGRGPGNVDKKDLGRYADWGNLPPKEREAALQQVLRQFPGHYRDVVEQYFRGLASESGSGPKE